MEKPNTHNKKYWKDGGTSEFLYQKYIYDLETYINKLEKQLSICGVGSSLIVNIKSFGEFIHKLCETDFTKRKKQYKYKGNWYGFVELKDIYRREFLD